jgi:hypothetical protein
VAVIGAGLSGLAAARRLRDAGLKVRVFDKARGAGGRCATRRRDEARFDHGAQYFTARDARFRRELEGWLASGQAAEWHPALAEIAGDGSVAPKSGTTVRFVGVPGMSALSRTFRTGLELRLNHRVEGVEGRPGRWRLRGAQTGPDETFDAVLFAVPAPQIGPLLPRPCAWSAEAEAVRMLPCWALLLGLEARLPLAFDAAFVNGHPLRWLARNGSKPGRPAGEAWVVHAGPEWSRRYLERDPEDAAGRLLDLFRGLTGTPPLKPSYASAHRWRYALPEAPLDGGSLWDPETRLGACGDWCHGARLEGAFLSGLHLADRLAAG